MASRELQNRVKSMVKKAYDEKIMVTELNDLIKKYWEEMEISKKGLKIYNQYREPTEEEVIFREKVYEFFSREISLEDFSKCDHKIRKSNYQFYLSIFSDIMCAVKMLKNDDEKITNYNIRDILWVSRKYKNYSALLTEIGYSVKIMWEIVFYKEIYLKYNFGLRYSPTKRVSGGYLKWLAENGIQ